MMKEMVGYEIESKQAKNNQETKAGSLTDQL